MGFVALTFLPSNLLSLTFPYQNGDRGQRRASSASSPSVRPAAPMSKASEMATNAASLLDGVQNQAPFANM